MVIVHYVVSADPGFPRGGCLSGGGVGGTNLLFGIGIIFAKNYMKMKKNWTGHGGESLTPLTVFNSLPCPTHHIHPATERLDD